MNDLRPKFEKPAPAQPRIKITIPEVPPGKDVKKFYDEQTPEVQKDLSKKIVEKAIVGLAEQNRNSIVDERVRQKVLVETTRHVEPYCRVCSSRFYGMYVQWEVDGVSRAEMARLSFFFEKDSEGSAHPITQMTFSNHFRDHGLHKDLVRRLIVLNNPDINPKNVATGMLQLLSEDFVRDEEYNLRKAKAIKDLLKVIDEMNKTDKKPSPVVDNSTTNFVQINQGGNVPLALDTMKTAAGLTEGESKRLEELEARWNDKGTNKIKAMIPKEVPVVSPSKASGGKNIINVKEDD
jgi:hypothetical protein